MQFSVATNFDPALVERLRGYPVHDFFGAIPMSIVGSGRPTFILPEVEQTQVEEYIKLAHAAGIKFTYLLNAPCLGNLEYEPQFHRQILEYIEWIYQCGVDYVTVTIPFIVELVKRRFPELKVKVSVIANINGVAKLRYYQNLGADVITIDYMVNRNFQLLEQMREAAKTCKLELLANDLCLLECPYRLYHYNITAHASQARSQMRGFYVDYCLIRCTIDFLTEPAEYLKSPWIKPEDIHRYEAIGIDYLKLSDRCKSTEWLQNVVSAYSSRRYNGNLLDILNNPQPSIENDVRSKKFIQNLASAEHWQNQTLQRFFLLEKGTPIKPTMINSKLDGFINFFQQGKCHGSCGERCQYCYNVAKNVVQLDYTQTTPYLNVLKSLVEDFTSGKLCC